MKDNNRALRNLLPNIWFEKGYAVWRKSLKSKPKGKGRRNLRKVSCSK